MIRLKIREDGWVVVKATKRGEKKKLDQLKYLRSGKGLKVTFWTYIKDLMRDFQGSTIRVSKSSKKNLKTLVESTKASTTGDDDFVRALFTDEYAPYPYQFKGIHFINNLKRVLLADDTGLGKTIQSVGAMMVAFARREIRRAIVVVPSGLKYQWHDEITEIAREGSIPGDVVVSSGTKAARRQLYKAKWRVLITSPGVAVNDADLIQRISEQIDFVILDEASTIKNAEIKTSIGIKTIFKDCLYKVALTATPLENKLADLFSIFDWVDRRVFISKQYFNERYIVWRKRWLKVTKNGRTFRMPKLEPRKYVRLNEVREKISHCYLRRRVSEVSAELPSLVINLETVELGAQQMQVYRALKQKTSDEIDGLKEGAGAFPMQYLRMACNSTALVVEGEKRPKHAKVERLKQLLENELHEDQIIVFTEYESFISKVLVRELRRFSVCCYTGKMNKRERNASVDSFVSGDKRILLATKAGERGLNLQCASVIVNLDLPFNPASLKQRVGRAIRIGSKHETVRMINFVASKTLEQYLILDKLYSKRKLFEEIFFEDELTNADPLSNLTSEELKRLL